MLICKKCKTEILAGTDAAEKGICIPCSENRSLFDDVDKNIRTFNKKPDLQYIQIERLSKSKQYVDYEVTSTLWDNDPRFRSRHIKVGSVTGVLRINKTNGEIIVVYPIAHDKSDKILLRAKHILTKAYKNGEFPKKTCFASG